MQFLAAYIMQGRLQAMMVASSLALLSLLLPPVSIVSTATVALVSLRLGAKEGLYVLLCSCLAAALLSMLLIGGYQFALMYALVLWLPVWVIAVILREGRRLEFAVETAVALGVVLVLGFFLLQTDPIAFWRQILTEMMQPMLDAQPDVSKEMAEQSAAMVATFMTGGVAAGSVFGLLFGLFLARWWQSALYNPGGFRIEFLAMRPHKLWAMALICLSFVAAVTSGFAVDVLRNVVVVLSTLFIITGVAVLHSLFANGKNSRLWLTMFYITLFTIPHVLVIIAVFGLLDAWLDLRNKFKPNGA